MGPKKDEMVTVLERLQALETEVAFLKKAKEGLEARVQAVEKEKQSVVAELKEVRGEQKKVASYSGVVRAEVEKVQAVQERHDRVLREANIVVTGLEDIKEETEEVTKERVEEVLQKGLRLAPSGTGSVLQAVRLGKYAEGKKRPVLVKCKSSAGAGEILKSRSGLKDAGKEFEDVYVNPDRTPEERERVRKAVAEMRRLRKEGKEAFVTMSGDLVVVGEGGERRRTSFKRAESASPWAVPLGLPEEPEDEGEPFSEGEARVDSFVEVTRSGRSKKGGSAGGAMAPAPRA
jgi:hypothetical protein